MMNKAILAALSLLNVFLLVSGVNYLDLSFSCYVWALKYADHSSIVILSTFESDLPVIVLVIR